ncbi:MAG: serine/threonine-protein kinase, partial [Myxococcota bacterium]|nr:serine/threonine-protein kinase [Myxococcota bacterium]
MLRPGDRLGPYVVEAELGRGGAGVVVAARAVEPVAGPLHVAIKARLAADGPDAARFLREMGALRALRVPGTVRLHSAGQAGPIAWFSMDRVDGVDLRARAATNPEPAARGALVARLATTLLETVAGVHQRGFVHRDLKPGNVLVDGMDRVWLLDFGVARGWRSPTAALTHPGAVIGTLPYMAPEQVTGQTAGPEVDVFAAGLLLHEAIAGPRAPARAPQEWLARQCLEHLPPLAVSVPGTPSGLSAIVSAMLAFSPEDRPTAPECVDALRAIGSGSTAVPLRPAPPRFIGRDALVRSLTGSARIDGPTLVSFEGPAGSGKRRLAEAIRRRLLLRGMTGRRLQVRPHAPGAGLGALLSAMVTARPADPQDAAALSTVWPSLPGAPPPTQRAARRAVAEAAAHVIQQASETTPLVIEVRAAQDMDPLLADTLLLLARRAPTDLLILLCVDDRWPGPAWQRLVQKAGSTKLVRNPMPDLDETEAQALCASLGCPDAGGPGSPLRVAEAAWEDLARRSGTPRTVLPWALLPMALLDRPVPDAAVRALGAAPDALARQGLLRGEPEMGWMLADESVRTLARAHIMDRVAAATRLQAALEETR